MSASPELLAFKAGPCAARANSLGATLSSTLLWCLLGLLVIMGAGALAWRLWLLPYARRKCRPKFLGHYYLYPPQGQQVVANKRKPAPKAAPKNTGMSASNAPYSGAPYADGDSSWNSANSGNGANANASDNDMEEPQSMDAAMAHAITPAGAPLVLDCGDMDIVAVARTVQETAVQGPRIFGLHGNASATRVFVPRPDGSPWDMYGPAPDAEAHTVAVFAMPKESWLCSSCL